MIKYVNVELDRETGFWKSDLVPKLTARLVKLEAALTEIRDLKPEDPQGDLEAMRHIASEALIED